MTLMKKLGKLAKEKNLHIQVLYMRYFLCVKIFYVYELF